MISQDNLKELEEKGFLERTVDPTLDLFEEIEKLKRERTQLFLLIIIRKAIFKILQIL